MIPLGESIRLGIGVVKEARWVFLTTWRNEVCGCAIGTAVFVNGDTARDTLIKDCRNNGLTACHRLWPWTKAPSRLQGSFGISTIASELSRRHSCGETREALAAWIESIDPTLAPPVAEPVEVVFHTENVAR